MMRILLRARMCVPAFSNSLCNDYSYPDFISPKQVVSILFCAFFPQPFHSIILPFSFFFFLPAFSFILTFTIDLKKRKMERINLSKK